MTDWAVDATSTPPKNRYAKLGLARNPFSAAGLAPERPSGLPASKIRAKLEEFVASFLQTGSYQAAVLIGPYGSGKTHHMRLLEKLFQKDTATRVVYLASAQNEPRQVVAAVLQELGRGDLAKLVWRPILTRIHEMQTADPKQLRTEFGDDRTTKGRQPQPSVAMFPDDVFPEPAFVDYRRFVEAFQKRRDFSLRRLRTFAISVLAKHLNIATPAAALLFGTTEEESLRAAGASDLLLSSPTTDRANEAEVLAGLSKLLGEDGTTRLVILIDEFEGVSMLERMTRKQSVEYLYALRMLVDKTAPTATYALVLATTPQAFDLARKQYAAVESRFTALIRLPVIDQSTAREILSATLDTARLPSSPGGIHPFTEGFLSALLETGVTVPRMLVVRAHRAIELAASDKKAKEIGADVVPQLTD